MNVKEWYACAFDQLYNKQDNVSNLLYELLSFVLKKDKLSLLVEDIEILQNQQKQLNEYVQQLKNNKPWSKIIGKKDFCEHSFIVNEDVLDPRVETQMMVKLACDYIIAHNGRSVLELGVGSGCVIISIMKSVSKQWKEYDELMRKMNCNNIDNHEYKEKEGSCSSILHKKPSQHPDLYAVGVDICDKALSVARQNAAVHNVQLNLIQSDWWSKVPKRQFDVIVSNPPYIAYQETIGIEVQYDPALALYANADGFAEYRKILDQAYMFLSGVLIIEIPLRLLPKLDEYKDVYIIKTYPCSADNIVFCICTPVVGIHYINLQL